MSYTKLAVKGAIITLVISLIAAFMGYIVRLILARRLSVEDFGLFYAVFAFLGMVAIFKSLGFDKCLAKFIPDFKYKNDNNLIKTSIIYVCFIQLITGIITIAGIYLLSDYLSANFFHSSKAGNILTLMAISFSIESFVLVLKFSFQGFKKMVYFSGIDLIRMILVSIIVLIGFKLDYGLLSPVLAYIIVPIILIIIFGWVFITSVFPQFMKSKFVLNIPMIKEISKYSFFLVENSVASLILQYTDMLALTYFSNLKNVGLYSIASPTTRVLMYFPRAIGGILLPLSAELWAGKKDRILKEGIESLYKYSIILIVPLVFTMFSFAELLITVLYGSKYASAANSMKILSIGMIFAIIYGININFFAGIGKPQITSKIVYTAALVNLVMDLILIPLIGINGAAITSTTSYFVMMIMGLMYIQKFIKVEFPLWVWAKTLTAGIVFIFVVWLLKQVINLNVWLETAIILLLSGTAYIALLFLLKVIRINEIKDVYKRIAK